MSRLAAAPGAAVRLAGFAGWYGWQVVVSATAVLRDVLTGGQRSSPRVVRFPLASRSEARVTAIGLAITLTPGTLTLGVSAQRGDRYELLVHSMYHPNGPTALADLREMEERMLRATTLHGPPPSPAAPGSGGAR